MNSFEHFAVLVVLNRSAKIDDFDNFVLFFINKEIFWLEVSVYDSDTVAICDTFENLRNNSGGIVLAKSHFANDFFEKFTSFAILGDEEVFLLVFKNFE